MTCALECPKLGLLTEAAAIALRLALTPHAKEILAEHAVSVREAASKLTGAALREMTALREVME